MFPTIPLDIDLFVHFLPKDSTSEAQIVSTGTLHGYFDSYLELDFHCFQTQSDRAPLDEPFGFETNEDDSKAKTVKGKKRARSEGSSSTKK